MDYEGAYNALSAMAYKASLYLERVMYLLEGISYPHNGCNE